MLINVWKIKIWIVGYEERHLNKCKNHNKTYERIHTISKTEFRDYNGNTVDIGGLSHE